MKGNGRCYEKSYKISDPFPHFPCLIITMYSCYGSNLVVDVASPREEEGKVEARVSAWWGIETWQDACELQQHHHTWPIAVCTPCQLLCETTHLWLAVLKVKVLLKNTITWCDKLGESFPNRKVLPLMHHLCPQAITKSGHSLSSYPYNENTKHYSFEINHTGWYSIATNVSSYKVRVLYDDAYIHTPPAWGVCGLTGAAPKAS